MKKSHLLYLLLLVSTLTFAGCAGLGGGATGPDGIEESGSPAGDSAPGGGGGDVMPPISIAPKNIIIGSEDSQGIVSGLGFEGAIDTTSLTSSMQVAFSTTDLTTVTAINYEGVNRKMVRGVGVTASNNTGLLNRLLNYASRFTPNVSLFPSATADEFAIDVGVNRVDGTSYMVGSVCTREDTACCPINADGSFYCPVMGDNTQTFNIYVTDGTYVSGNVAETPNPAVLYTGNPIASASVANGKVYSMSVEGIMETAFEDALWRMMGDYTSEYEAAGFDSDAPAYDKLVGNDSVLIAGSENNYEAFIIDRVTGGVGHNPQVVTAQAFVGLQSALKSTQDGFVRYGIKEATGNARAYIRYLTTDGTVFEDTAKSIYFLYDDLNGAVFHKHKQTYAFDLKTLPVDSTYKYTLVVFRDGTDNIRLRMVQDKGVTLATQRFGTNTIGTYADYGDGILDMDMFELQTTTANARYVLLDNTNDRLQIGTYNVMGRNKNVSAPTVNVAVGSNPIDWAFNTNHSKAYVINKDDNTMSVVDLTAITPVAKTYDINLLTAGKGLTCTPNSIEFINNSLLVGCKNFEGGLNVSVADVEASAN